MSRDGRVRIRWADDAKVQMTNAPVVTAAVTDVAEQIARVAEAAAPEAEGDYRAGIVVVETVADDGTITRTVRATDPKSALIEFGSGPRENDKGANRGQMPAYRPLTGAADTLGLRVKGGGK